MNNEVYYKIIHTKYGLDYAEMQWFDEFDYTLASNKSFEFENEAIEYGKFLASLNGISWAGSDTQKGILDE